MTLTLPPLLCLELSDLLEYLWDFLTNDNDNWKCQLYKTQSHKTKAI